MIWTLF